MRTGFKLSPDESSGSPNKFISLVMSSKKAIHGPHGSETNSGRWYGWQICRYSVERPPSLQVARQVGKRSEEFKIYWNEQKRPLKAARWAPPLKSHFCPKCLCWGRQAISSGGFWFFNYTQYCWSFFCKVVSLTSIGSSKRARPALLQAL